MDHKPRDMSGFCRVGYMDVHGRSHHLDIAEWSLPWAIQHGWSLVFRYSDTLTEPIDPAQSNPRRDETEDGA